MEKRITKSNTNRVISGVCGGLGEHFNIDPTIVRIVWLVITLFTAGFGGIIFYLACLLIFPEAPK